VLVTDLGGVTVKDVVFWGLMPCNVECQCFREEHSAFYLLGLLFDPEGVGSSCMLF
jgi:hypothetical protein